MKEQRQKAILKLIQEEDLEVQEELLERLHKLGFACTQATISRDIKELGLIKVSDGEGNYYYAVGRRDDGGLEKRYQAVFVQSLKSVDYAGHITCIRCHTGMANAACAALDTMGFAGVVGTLAGDDTIFVLMRSEPQARALADQIASILQER